MFELKSPKMLNSVSKCYNSNDREKNLENGEERSGYSEVKVRLQCGYSAFW